MFKVLKTQRLTLIDCDQKTLEIAIESDLQLGQHLRITVPENWSEFGQRALTSSLKKITSSENEQGWWTYLPIHTKDQVLIGICGYKGKPTAGGMVEIGYEITKLYRNKGLATEVVNALVKNAFQNHLVNCIQAHTLGENNASTKVLLKCGFLKTLDIEDDKRRRLWRWELKKQSNK